MPWADVWSYKLHVLVIMAECNAWLNRGESGCKWNLPMDLQQVAKETHKFTIKSMQVAKRKVSDAL